MGVKIVFQKGDRVLAIDCDQDGWNLPSTSVLPDECPRESADSLFKTVTGKKDSDLIPVLHWADDEFQVASSFRSFWSGSPKVRAEWVYPQDVLCGKWGLSAIDIFNRIGVMRRPRLNVEELYRICSRALSRNSETVYMEAVDMVVDEVTLLMDIGKPWAVDALLRELDVTRLHADVLSAIQVAIEDIPELPARDSFNLAASRRISHVDGLRTKIRFGGIDDVRAAALKIYRRKGSEFGEALRAGTLSDRFPRMKHIADAEAKIRDGERKVREKHVPSKATGVPPLSEWPDTYRRPVADRKDVTPEYDPYKPGERGVCLERPTPRRTTWFETTDERTPGSEFLKRLRKALDGWSDEE